MLDDVDSEFHLHGMERFPMNLIEGTRSAWAAAWRRALVASILIGIRSLILWCGR